MSDKWSCERLIFVELQRKTLTSGGVETIMSAGYHQFYTLSQGTNYAT